jgi:hypothetical protein
MADSPIQRYFGGLTRDTFLFAFTSLFADISTEMLYPVLPVFLTQTLKATGSIVGLVDGFAQAAQNIVQGFSGALSDKLQKHRARGLSHGGGRQTADGAFHGLARRVRRTLAGPDWHWHPLRAA